MTAGATPLAAPDRYVAGMERLVQAVRDLASARTLDDVAEIVRHAAREMTGADGATFVLREEDRCYYLEEDAIAPLWRGKKFPMSTCISGWAMVNREPAVIPDIYVDERIPHDAYRPTFVKSLVMVPVRAAEPVAAIGNYWAEHHEASDTEVRLLQALADSTAVALENVRVLDELEDRVEARTAELAAANADLRNFAAVAAHDLKGPLDTIAGLAELVDRRHGDGMSDEAREVVAAIADRARSMGTLIHSLLDYARAGAGQLRVGEVDLRDVASEAVARLDAAVAERHAELAIDDLPTVQGDAGLLAQVVQNLVANAIAHTPRDRIPVVHVEAALRDGMVEVTVRDNGRGVPDAEKVGVFEAFQRGSTAANLGTGLGLAISRRIVEAHGGRIECRDAHGGGAEFAFTLPAAAAGL